jgi:hypothetical protein
LTNLASANLNVALLHYPMVDRSNTTVATSITLIDIHDIARSSCTFGCRRFFVVHPGTYQKQLARSVLSYWQDGEGRDYNAKRSEALSLVDVVGTLEDAIIKTELETGQSVKLIGTSAKSSENRVSFLEMSQIIASGSDAQYIMLLGTGWGMHQEILDRVDYFLEPILGAGAFNHLSVRSAAAIMLHKVTDSSITLNRTLLQSPVTKSEK